MGEMKNVPNEKKKEFGQILNEFKQFVEAKYDSLKESGDTAEEAGDTALSKEQAIKEFEAAQARALPEAMPSVTEHTTRLFEPIYRERK